VKQVFYIHGGNSFLQHEDFLNHLRTRDIRDLPGTERTKWTKTLREDLGPEYEVFMPQMPCAETARYEEWKIWFERHFKYVREGILLVGCSLGAMFLIRYLSEVKKLPFSISGLILMAGAVTKESEHEFVVPLAETRNILRHTNRVIIMHSTDDFVVPYEHAEKLKAALPEAELVTFTDRNHFLQPEFPEMIDLIKKMA
jgi:predicted alpha/beta hydrolase family esterase